MIRDKKKLISPLDEKIVLTKTITLLRFPMAVIIMLLHSSFEHELINGVSIFENIDAPIYHHIDYMFVRNICMIAVPLFFVISGFLFFYKEQTFTVDVYWNKLKKRIKSLFIPYVIWNILILLLYIVVQNVSPSMNSGRTKLVIDFSLRDFVMCFWSMKDVNGMGTPIDGPLWFIRDLMVMMVLSPIFYFLIKRLKVIVPLLLLLLYVGGIPVTSLFFFAVGAYFGINKINFVAIARKLVVPSSVIYFTVLSFLVLLMGKVNIPLCISFLEIVIGVIVAIGIASVMVEKGFKISAFLAGSTFFLFASHSEILKVFIRLSSRFGPLCDVFLCIAYFLCPAIVCGLLLITYKWLMKSAPKVASLLSGGR